MKTLFASFLAFPLVAFSFCAKASVGPYSFTELGALGGIYSSSFAFGISDSGQVVGYSSDLGFNSRATLWNGTTATALSPVGGTESFAAAINNSGQVVGYSYAQSSPFRATIWNSSTPTNLGAGPLGGSGSGAWAINSSGQVVGFGSLGSGDGHAILWNGSIPTDLGTGPQGATGSLAYGINDAGQIAGYSWQIGSPFRPILWSANGSADLGTLGGDSGFARAINNQGQVVGGSTIAIGSAASHATLWNGGQIVDLGTLGGSDSYANSINESGIIVGAAKAASGSFRATIWKNGAATDLNTFLNAELTSAGWILQDARDINNGGSIVGIAVNSITNENRAFMLAPVPELDTHVMMLAGGCLLGFLYSRRTLRGCRRSSCS